MLKLIVSGLIVAGAFVAAQRDVVIQDDKQDAKKQQAQDMALYAKMATPNEMHKKLQGLVGKWTQKNTFEMGNGPEESTGTCEYRPLHEGRFVIGDIACKFKVKGEDGKEMEFPWTGFNLLGYDNVTKQYQSCWCDSMGTGMYLLPGTVDASGKVITFSGVMKDAKFPEGAPFKSVYTWDGPDKHTIELWGSKDGKTTYKMGTIVETRVK